MAQCRAEGRKHPTMDLYVGIFNSKLYTSDRGATRVGSVDKWSRNAYKAPSAHAESFREDVQRPDRSSFQSRSFRDSNSKPPVVSDLGDLNRKLTSHSNVGSTRFEKKSSLVEVGHEGGERRSPLTDVDYGVSKKSSPQIDVDYGIMKKSNLQADVANVHIEKKSLVTDVGHVGDENMSAGYGLNSEGSSHTEVGYMSIEKKSPLTDVGYGTSKKIVSAKDGGYIINDKKSSQANVSYESGDRQSSQIIEAGYGNSEKKGSQSGMWYGTDVMNSLCTDVGYGTNEVHNPQTEMSYGSIEKRIPQVDVGYGVNSKHILPSEANFGTRGSQVNAKNPQLIVGNGIGNTSHVDCTSHALQKGSQAVSEGALQRSNSKGTHQGIVVGNLDRSSNSNDRVNGSNLQGNGNAMKGPELSATDGPLLSHEAGLPKADKTRDTVAAKRCLLSTNEFARYERKLDSVALVNGAVSGSDRVADEVLAHSSARFGDKHSGMVPELCSSSRHQRSIEHNGEAIMGFPNANGYIKAGNVGEVDGNSQGNANGLALKESPIRGHNFAANLRVGGLGSMDSSSSHGGSSHSGSPTAAESNRDSRVSSFGNILISKGSPHSVSSRSMGSASITSNGMLASSKSSFSDIPALQFRYSTSSGRKSAEIVPNRRSSEMIPNRKSSEMIPNGHLRGAAMQGSVGEGMLSSINVNRGSGNLGNGSSISLNNGNLLVGSTNGNVLSVGGGIKSNSKQGETVNLGYAVDCTLLKKAQASSDPEELKNAGNEYYRRRHFAEALIFYNRVVSLCPGNAAYRSNRAAALSGLGRLGEAVQECEDAIRLDSSYVRAHQRVAALYLRLGIVERAKQHFLAAGQETDLMEAQRLRNVNGHILKCIEARKRGEWQNVIRESDAAVVAGADSAPQIFGFKSEALLGLHKPDEADGVCTAAQRVESSLVKAGVVPADPFLLTVRAQVDMALGRFEGAVEAAKSAAKIDPHNDNVAALLRKAQAVCHTRTAGNELFKVGRFFEALALYAEGLESDPTNAVLLCNRAACRSKLGQWEKAVEDCDAALRIQPNYTKALMRRANCWTKLERWEDALQDYELLRRKMPEDLEVARGLFDTHVAIKKSRGEDTRKMKFGGDVEEVVNDEQFQEAISSPGLSVVQFITRWSERCRQLSPFVEDLCRRNPCVNFVKVDVEDNPYLAKIESVSFIPTFKIFKNGQKVKEMLGPTEQSLEYALKHYTL